MANNATNGTDVLLLADVGGSPTVVGSQRGVTFEETSENIDVSSKEQREMRVLSGRYSSTVSLEHLYVPDDTSYLALRDANRNGTFITIRRQEFSSPFEECSAIVTSLSGEFPDQGEAVISIELMVDGAWSAV
jgi:TP901-1 family phage major tail protein